MFQSSFRLRIAKISVLLPTNLLSGTLLRQSLFESALSARFQIVGVTPHFLDDVFRLNLALEPTQGILQRLALMQSNFCQSYHPSLRPQGTESSFSHLCYKVTNDCLLDHH